MFLPLEKKRDLEVYGYFVSDDEDTLDLFACVYKGVSPAVQKIPKGDLEKVLKRSKEFARKAFQGLHETMEPAAESHDMAAHLRSS